MTMTLRLVVSGAFSIRQISTEISVSPTMISSVENEIIGVPVKNFYYIRESVDSLCRDGADARIT